MSNTQQLNEVQLQAVNSVDGPVLVLAGAGSGKTRVLTNRIVHMVNECGIKPYNILAITFTNKAAQEMRSRLSQFDCNADLMHIATIHSMCALILRIDGKHLGYNSNFTIYSEADKERVVKQTCKELADDDSNLVGGAMSFIGNCKNLGLSVVQARDVYQDLPNVDKLVEIYERYANVLLKSNSMDFDDLLTNTLRLLKEFPEVLEKYASKYQYISVDEYQDINKVQNEIITLLSSKHNNLFVVGDDDQSIYGWRGADVTNILEFNKRYPNAKVFKLEQNYRSSKKILNIANVIISDNLKRHEKKLWTENDDGVKVEVYNSYNEGDEATFVIQQILALIKYNNYSLNDFAILMRVNALSRSIEQECLKYGLSSKVFGGFKFFERKEIKDLTAYLRIISNPLDNQSVTRIINIPKRGIGETTVEKLYQLSNQFGISILDVLTNEEYLSYFNASTATKLRTFGLLYLQLLGASKQMDFPEFVTYLVRTIDYQQVFNDDSDRDKLLNIDQFIESVIEFCNANKDATIDSYLQSITLVSDVDEKDGNFVTIATIHAVKGLEFKCVFIIGNEEGLFPVNRATFNDREMEEERRLMYVACTRAMSRLYLTRARSRFMYGKREETIASRFFKQIENITSPKPLNNYTDPDTNSFRQIGVKMSEGSNKSIDVTSDVKCGTKLIHKIFGEGTVISAKDGNADVVFASVGVKTLSIKYAPITIKGN